MKWALPLLVTAFLLLGCSVPFPGSGNNPTAVVAPSGPPVRIRPAAPTSLRHSTASNRAFAQADAKRLLRLVVLPPSAREVPELPARAPRRLEDIARTTFMPGIAIARRIWIVDAPRGNVVRYFKAHVPLRPRPEVPFRAENASLAFKANGSYAFPPADGRSWSRWLNVDTAKLPGGRTVVVTQAGDAWIHTSQASELLPRGIKRIDLQLQFGKRRRHALVRNRIQAAQIVAQVNAFGLADAEPIICPAVYRSGPYLTLRFEAADGRELARASVVLWGGQSGPCNPVELTIGGKTMPPLIGADLHQVLRQEVGLGTRGL